MFALKFIRDSGHGWLEVPLDMFPDAIHCGTGYGYIDHRNNKIYLEEDCEAHMFIQKYPETARHITHEYVDGDAALRNLPRNEALLTI